MKLLLVEDDVSMRTTLERSLARRGMQVQACADGGLALAAWTAFQPDVVVLDLSLPGLDGLQVLERARRDGLATPVLLLTARGTVGDRVLGLNAGADDYLPKPFDLDELEARLRALARRRSSAADPGGEVQVGRVRLDRAAGAFYVGAQVLELTPRESALLQALFTRPGHAVSKEKLFELVFPGEADVQYEAVEVVAYRLRKKLAGTGVSLMTLRGLGYLVKGE
ncbi:response regulator transcription factor [Ramlibacter henchirensis]|uniref:Response regulator transcription factor n=1 Tax=Ramlibacter henchirensis TaxID=204072 RepID=A0A4Z0BPT8_9BURK|nr:response regulator transcription factor [Ramlibacter henchirensis]TFZ00410.1 response regulator transcription factor [Ramlibacter henchirensis]